MVELVIGGIVFIPIALFCLDLLTLVLCESINDHMAKNAARAAANQTTVSTAKAAARTTIGNVRTSDIIVKTKLVELNSNSTQVSVQTSMEVKVPAPFPFFSGATLIARCTEPVIKPAML